MKRFFRGLCVCLMGILCLLFVGCSDTEGNVDDNNANIGTETPVVANPLNRKVVYTVYLYVDSENVQKGKKALDEKCATLGGYIEYVSEEYDEDECYYASITYRIPTEKLNDFITQAEEGGKVTYKTVDSTDITTSYVNAAAQKTALETRKASLQALLEDTTITAGDRISIINEISIVDTELQAVELLLTQYDTMIDYSTVYLTFNADYFEVDLSVPLLIIGCTLWGGGLVFAIVFAIVKKNKQKKNKYNALQ